MFALTALKTALVITAFVAVMMLIVEYLSFRVQGVWGRKSGASRLMQYLLAVVLGATPGCMGSYVVVALYIHGRLSLGALVATMIATSGGEAFVMLALFPRTALLLTGLLMGVGLAVAWITDRVWQPSLSQPTCCCGGWAIPAVEPCRCFSRRALLEQWKAVTGRRATLVFGLVLVAVAVMAGALGPPVWNWMRSGVLLADLAALGIAAVATDRFLEEKLWSHVVKKHVPGIFLWTFGVLLVLGALEQRMDVAGFVSGNPWTVLLLAVAIGIVPESGPHLVFVTLFAKGALPLSILVASSIVQDGHGMLPLLAASRRDFLRVKLINVAAGLLVGGAMLLAGY